MDFDGKRRKGYGFSGEQLSENLRRLMEEFKINTVQLHKNTGVALTTIKRIRSNPDANPTITSLIPLANFFSVSINQLIGIDPLPGELSAGVYAEKRELWTEVPVIEWQDISKWPNIDLATKPTIQTDATLSESAFAVVLESDTFKGFGPGSVLIIDTLVQPNHKDFAIAHDQQENRTALMQKLTQDDTSYFESLDSAATHSVADMDGNLRIVGTLLQVRMDMKER